VFFLHTHAAMFLILLLLRPLDWAVNALPALHGSGGFLNLGAGLFAAWYVYRAMRVYYGQRRLDPFTKFIVVAPRTPYFSRLRWWQRSSLVR